MTYLKNDIEYLDSQEMAIYRAVGSLNRDHRSTNTSQVAARSGYSRTTVSFVTAHLKARGFLKDTGKGNAYNWRLTNKTPETDPQ